MPRSAAGEAELRLGIEAAAEYDDSVISRTEGEIGDYLGRLGPQLELRDDQGRLRYELRYFPSYEKFLDLSDLDGWNHDALARVTWLASERTTVVVREQYLDTNRAVEILDTGEPIDPTGEAPLVLGRRGFTQNIAYGELQHRLTRADNLALTVQNVLSESEPFEEEAVTEGDVTSAGLSWLRTLSGRDQAGLILRYTDQSFEDVTARSETRSEFYNVSLQWIHRFDPTWSLSVSGGPAWVTSELPDTPTVFTDQPLYPLVQTPTATGPVRFDSCPSLADGTVVLTPECEVIPVERVLALESDSALVFRDDLLRTTDLGVIGEVPDPSSSGLTYFAAVALTKQWRTVAASLRYSRDASTTTSAAGNVRDVVQASITWQPKERWRVNFIAAWEQRDQETSGVVFDQLGLVPATAVVLDPASEPFGIGLVSIGQSAGRLAREVDRSVANERYTLKLNVAYRLTQRTTLFARLSWIEQSVDDPFFGPRDSSRFNAVLGVRYYFDPIQLPI